SARQVYDCATWLARWRVDHPESLAARLYDPRSVPGAEGAAVLAPPMIARVAALFRGAPGLATAETNPAARAPALPHPSATFYVHAIPFDRNILRNVWSECARNGSEAAACATARLRVDGRLGRFELPHAAD